MAKLFSPFTPLTTTLNLVTLTLHWHPVPYSMYGVSEIGNNILILINFYIMWQTRKIETLFKLKDKNTHPSHVIYRGTCTCNQVYIGETARNLAVRINEHSDTNKQSEPAKHLKKNPDHKFAWDILSSAHSWTKRKIKEAFYISRYNPELTVVFCIFLFDRKRLVIF